MRYFKPASLNSPRRALQKLRQSPGSDRCAIVRFTWKFFSNLYLNACLDMTVQQTLTKILEKFAHKLHLQISKYFVYYLLFFPSVEKWPFRRRHNFSCLLGMSRHLVGTPNSLSKVTVENACAMLMHSRLWLLYKFAFLIYHCILHQVGIPFGTC